MGDTSPPDTATEKSWAAAEWISKAFLIVELFVTVDHLSEEPWSEISTSCTGLRSSGSFRSMSFNQRFLFSRFALGLRPAFRGYGFLFHV